MNIYRVDTDVAYGQVFSIGDEDTRERWRDGIGRPGVLGSIGLSLERHRSSRFLPVDCCCAESGSGDGFLLNARAREVLKPLLADCGEYIPATLEDYDYQWFHCTAWRDIADVDRIEGEPWSSSSPTRPRWFKITRWAFHPDRLQDLPAIFRVPQKPVTVLLCTDLFKLEVENNDLIGLEFTHLWSSKDGGTEHSGNLFADFFGAGAKAWGERVDAKRAIARARLGLKPERKRRRRKPSAPQSHEPVRPPDTSQT